MDQYTILENIGEGAHGLVYKAKHIEVYRYLKLIFNWFFVDYLSHLLFQIFVI